MLASTGSLLCEEPLLRLRTAYGFLSFGTFSVLWTSLAFLLADRFHEQPATIGAFGLAGAAGALTAMLAGRFSDRGWARWSTGGATGLLALSWLALWAGGRSLVWLVVGIVVLDIGAQGLHITNQSEIYRLRPEARSRLTAAYMVVFFAGGGIGSAVSSWIYGSASWGGVCILGASIAGAAFLLWVATQLLGYRPAAGVVTDRGTSSGSSPRSGRSAGPGSAAG